MQQNPVFPSGPSPFADSLVTLEGMAEGWKLVRDKAEAIVLDRCSQNWGCQWLMALLPLLDKFNHEYAKGLAGEIGDQPFWCAGSGLRRFSHGH